MTDKFHPLNSNEVVSIFHNFHCIALRHPTFKVGEFTQELSNILRRQIAAEEAGNQNKKPESIIIKKWFDEGLEVELLKRGAEDWQKGKVKIKVSL